MIKKKHVWMGKETKERRWEGRLTLGSDSHVAFASGLSDYHSRWILVRSR